MFVCPGLSLGGSEHDFGNLLCTLAGSLGTSRAHWGCPWGPLGYIVDGWTMIASHAHRSAHAIRIIISGLCYVGIQPTAAHQMIINLLHLADTLLALV